MTILLRASLIAAALFTVSGCASDGGTSSGPALRTASNSAETECMDHVNANYGGKVRNLDVTSSEFSEANSLVMMKADGETWRCLVSDIGEIHELRVIE